MFYEIIEKSEVSKITISCFFLLFGFVHTSNSTDLKFKSRGAAFSIPEGGTITYCLNDPVDSVYCPSPANKTFLPAPGISDPVANDGWAYFDPAAAGIGTHTVNYDVASKVFYFVVTPPGVSTIAFKAGAPTQFCTNSGIIALSSLFNVTPATGSFYVDYVASPNLNTGAYTIQHTYIITYKGSGCETMSPALQITVYTLPQMIPNVLPIACSNVDSVPLNIWNPSGGTYTAAAGVTGSVSSGFYFHPSAGNQTLFYSLTQNGCTTTSDTFLTINPIPNVTLSSAKTVFCVTDADQPLVTNVVPVGLPGAGVFSGAGIVNVPPWSFSPSTAGLGSHSLVYTYTSTAGCSNSDTLNMQVGTLLYVNNLQPAYCMYLTDSFQLTYTPYSDPHIIGDTISGPGIKDLGNGTAWFYPGLAGLAGNKTITYRYTDAATSCVNIATFSTQTIALPVADFIIPDATPCSNDSSFLLTGNHAGGIFSGPAGTYNAAGVGLARVYPANMAIGTPQEFTYIYTQTGCTDTVKKQITVYQAPDDYTISGSGNYCSNSSGRAITLSGSQAAADVKYQLVRNSITNDSLPIDGTTSSIKWYNRKAGIYTVVAIDKHNLCTDTMTGSADIKSIPTPALYNVTGGGSYCVGGAGLSVKLSGSVAGTNYQLLLNGSPIDTLPGTGSELDFGLHTVAGTYKVFATLVTSGETCGRWMADSAIISTVALPVAFTMVGGDSAYCDGQSGVYIKLSNSTNGITYTLFRDGFNSGVSKVSTGGALSFGFQTTSGTYTIIGTNSIGCPTTMLGSRKVSVKLKPLNAQTPVGDDTICPGSYHTYYVPSITYATSYIWTVPAGAIISTAPIDNDTVTIFFSPAAVSGNITVKGNNNCGDGGSASLAVKVISAPTALGAITGAAKVCQNQTNVTYSISSKPGVTSYTWSAPAGATIIGHDTLINVNYGAAAFPGSIAVQANNMCGSSPVSSLAIDVVAAPIVTFNPPSGEITCDPTPVTVSVSSSTAGVSYAWTTSNGGYITGPANNASAQAASSGNYLITVTEPSFSCKTSGTITVTTDTVRPASVSITTSIPNYVSCNNSQVTLTATTPATDVTFTWSASLGGNIASVSGPNNENVNVDSKGLYTVKVTDNTTKCYRNQNIYIQDSMSVPNISVTNPAFNKISCKNTFVALSGNSTTPNAIYSWSGPGLIQFANSPTPIVYSTGIFTLTVTGPNGCTNAMTVQVNPDSVLPVFTIDAPEKLTCKKLSDTLSSFINAPGGTVVWSGPGIVSGGTTQSPVINRAGDYTMIVTQAVTGCKDSLKVTVLNDTITPDITFVLPPVITCNAPNVNITGNPTSVKNKYQWSTANGTIVTGANSKTVTVSKAGTYLLTVTDSTNGCVGTNSCIATENKTLPAVNIAPHGNYNCFAPALNLVGSSNMGAISQEWFTTDGNITAGKTNLTAQVNEGGTYKLVITNNTNGCKDSLSTFVFGDTAKPALSIVNDPADITCQITQVQLTALAANSNFSWTGPAGATINPVNGSTPIVDLPGTYYITATSTTNGCTKTDSIQVNTLYTKPSGVSISGGGILTCNTTSHTLTASVSSPAAGTIYRWYSYFGGAPVLLSNNNPVVINTPGTYKVEAIHPVTHCVDSDKITISQLLTAPTITFPFALPLPITCDRLTSQIISIVVPAGSDITWSGPGVFTPNNKVSSPLVNASALYTITVKHPVTGCPATATRFVGEDKVQPAFTIAVPDTITCTTTSVLLDATLNPLLADYTPSWSTAGGAFLAGISDIIDVSGTESGLFTLTIKNNDNGCSNSASINVVSDTVSPNVTVNPVPIPSKLTCAATQVRLSGYSTTPGTTLDWSGPGIIMDDFTANPRVSTVGTYTLTVTKASSGCTKTGSIKVDPDYDTPVKPNILAPQVLTCSRATVNLEVSPVLTGVEYSWSTPGTGIITDGNTAIAKVSQTGLYIVTVRSTSTGCTNSDSVTVVNDPSVSAVSIIGGPYTITCDNSTVQLNGSLSAGINPVWTTPSGHIVSYPVGPLGGYIPIVDAPGDYTLTVYHPVTGCPSSASVTVGKSVDVPDINYQPNANLLTCTNTQDTLYGEPADPGDSFVWLSDSAFVKDQATINPIVDKAGTYIIRVEDAVTHCIGTRAIVVRRDVSLPDVYFTTPAKLTCNRTEVRLKASTPISHPLYNWTTAGTGSIKPGDENVYNPVVYTPATYRITVTNQDNNCSSFKDVLVEKDTVAPQALVVKTIPKITCTNTTVQLTGTANPSTNIRYLWSGPGNIYNNGTMNPAVDAPGKYILTVTDTIKGCFGKDSVTVDVDTTTPNIWVYGSPSQLTCTKDTVQLKGNSSDNVSYLWTGPGNFNDKTLKEPYVDAPGTYQLTVKSNVNGCSNIADVAVAENKIEPSAPFSAGGNVCFGSPSDTLTATGTGTINWYKSAALGFANFIKSGNTFVPLTYTSINDYNFFITQTDPSNGCEGPAYQVTYSVKVLPANPVTFDKSICEGLPNPLLEAAGTVPAAIIKWYDTPGGTSLATATQYNPPATVNTAGTYPYYATQTDANGCESSGKVVTLTIYGIPAAPVVDKLSAEICLGSTPANFTAVGTNIKWYNDPALPAPIFPGNTLLAPATTIGTHNYYATQTSIYGCQSAARNVVYKIKALPHKYTVTGGGVYCVGQGGRNIGLNSSSNTVSYSLLLNGTTSVNSLIGSGAALNFGAQLAKGNYTVVADSSSCTTVMTGGVSIDTLPMPGKAGTVSGISSVCEGSANVTYSVPAISNANSYVWSVPAGATISSGLNSRQITVDFGLGSVTGNVNVYAQNGCGDGTISPNTQVVVNKLPADASNIILVGANNHICLGDTGKIYEVDAIANATSYEWILPIGATIISGQNTRQIKVYFLPTAAQGVQTIRVRGKNSCGTGAYSNPYSVTVYSNPTVNAGIDQDICTTQTTLQGNAVPAGGTGQWTLVYGSASITNTVSNSSTLTNIAQGENILTWKITENGCSTVDTVKINNNKVPVDAGSSLSICASEVTLSGSSVLPGTSGMWTVTGTTSFENASDPATKASNFGFGDNKLYWTLTKKGCHSTDSVIITNYRPTTPAAGGDISICTNSTWLYGNQPVYGTGLWQLQSGAGTIINPGFRNTEVRSIGIGKNVFIYRITNQICSLTDTVIVQNNSNNVNAGYDQTVCDNRTTLDANAPEVGATGQWWVLSGSATFLDSKQYNTKISGLDNGVNVLIWSITKSSCTNTDTVIITSNLPSTARAGTDQEVPSSTATLAANSPVVGSGKWSIISGSGTFANDTLFNTTVSGLNPGINVLRWTIAYKGCTSFDDVQITNGTLETISAGDDQTICTSYTQLDASRPLYGFGKWTVQQGSARFEDNETYNTKVFDLLPGTNILRWSVTLANIEFYDTVIIVNNEPTTAVVGPKQVLCVDSAVLTGNLAILGTGRWTLEGGSATIDDINLNNTRVTSLGYGDNTFRWTITNGSCVSSTVLTVTNDKPTVAYAGLDQTLCNNYATLMPNSPSIGRGEWSVITGAGFFSGSVVSNLAPGYNLLRWTIRNNNCESYDEVVINNYKPTTANAGSNTVVCVDSLFLSANRANTSLGETAYWSVMNGSGIIEDSSLNTTLVRRLGQNINVLRWNIINHGCMSYKDVSINYAYIKADAGTDIITCDDHVSLNANNPGIGKGEWSVIGGSGSAKFVSSSSPNSEVRNLDKATNVLRWTITNLTCVSRDEINVSNNSPSVAFAGGDQSLCGNTTTLAASKPLIGQGVWSVLSGSGTFTDTTSTSTTVSNIGYGINTYRWTITNKDCYSTDEVVISNNMPIGTFAGTDQILCDDSTSLSANAPSVGTGVWSITQGSGSIADFFNPLTTITKLAADTNILRWTVTNKHCVEYKEILLVNNMPTVANAGVDRTICFSYVTLDGNIPVEGTGEWSLISGAATFDDKSAYNSQLTNMNIGSNIFRWTITKQNCISFDNVSITNDLPTKPDAGSDIVVCDSTATLNGNKPVIGTGHWSVLSGYAQFEDTARNNTAVSSLGQGANVMVWTIKHNRCTLSDQVEVKNNLTNVYAGPDQGIFEDSTMLVGNQPPRGQGFWSLSAGNGNIATPDNYESFVTGLSEGLNTFTWSVNIDECISSDQVRITYYKLPTASFSVSQSEGCVPLEVKFTNTTIGSYKYRWSFGENDSTTTAVNPSYTYAVPGSFKAMLTVIGPDSMLVTKEQYINAYQPPKVKFDLVPQKIYIPKDILRCYNYSQGGETYLWNFGDGTYSEEFNPSHTYKDSGKYRVSLTVYTDNNCSDSLVIENGVDVIQTSNIKFPSSFTPSITGSKGGRHSINDYSNDVFYPIVIMGGISNYKMQVYSRWGILMFESKDIDVGWDGYFKGKLANEDVYIFRVTGRYNNGESFDITGDFLLLKRQ